MLLAAGALAASLALPCAAAKPGAGSGARAEVQMAVCAPPDEVVKALRLRSRGPELQVWLFDDSALTLFDRGVRLRLRVSGDTSELTLKVANQDCAKLDAKLTSTASGKCEYDVHDAAVVGAVSLSQDLDARRTADLLAGRVPVADTLDATQRDFLRGTAALWPLPASLKSLGPTRLSTYQTKKGHYDVDVSALPDGKQYVEISRKVPVKDVASVSDRMQADLSRAGVALCADQSGQARTKMLFMQR